ncbi:transposase [Halanaerobaculum tunisiense]
MANICDKYQYEILELEVMPDHIHIFLSTKPTIAPTDIVRNLEFILITNSKN